MANADSPSGFTQIGKLDGSAWNGKGRWYYCGTAEATAIFMGDMVSKTSGTSAGTAFGTYTGTCAAATAGDTLLLGAAFGFRTDPPLGNDTSLQGSSTVPRLEYRTGAVGTYVLVSDDPQTLYTAQVSSTCATSDLGKNFDVVTGAGSTTTFTSGHEINSTSVATANGQIRVLWATNLADGSNVLSSNTSVVCMVNEHAYKGIVGI